MKSVLATVFVEFSPLTAAILAAVAVVLLVLFGPPGPFGPDVVAGPWPTYAERLNQQPQEGQVDLTRLLLHGDTQPPVELSMYDGTVTVPENFDAVTFASAVCATEVSNDSYMWSIAHVRAVVPEIDAAVRSECG